MILGSSAHEKRMAYARGKSYMTSCAQYFAAMIREQPMQARDTMYGS
jgi:hypothetical protein